VPDYFALLTRAMIVLEGIAVTGNPDFDLFSRDRFYKTPFRPKTYLRLNSLPQILGKLPP
jgi:hypothetical protein